jgi:fimbrial chaperone protein
MSRIHRLACGLRLAALTFMMTGTDANALALVPIAQDFAPSGRSATQNFRLDNDSDRQVAVTVRIFTREMSLDGAETNDETKDFLVFPGNVVIGPRQSQVVRVQWKGTPTPARELAYRVIAEQQAIKAELGPNARAIQLVVRYVGSIYVLPKGVQPSVRLESARAITVERNQRALELVFNNRGRAHTLLDEPTLTLSAGGQTKTLNEDEVRGLIHENILAESKRRFLLPWPADLPFDQPKAEFGYQPLR